ncbi:major facilitator superfamily domain-containing protein [Rhexocercosporidium sp. MPI-PUGE-AT-0058]|nr:major facilitator superfamily domain-containing protein [Rhexocercosporidium sp. MPI-PUGE-AT-0058]
MLSTSYFYKRTTRQAKIKSHGHGPDKNIGSDPEKILSADETEDVKKDHIDYNRVDKAVAKYISDVAIDISPLSREFEKILIWSDSSSRGLRLWGATLALNSVATNFTHLVVLRTLLGIFEDICQPAFVYLNSMWYKREEPAATVSYWYMMNEPTFTYQELASKLHQLRILLCTLGIVAMIVMPDSPMRAKCDSEEDKKLMVERVRSNQTRMQSRRFRKGHIFEAFKCPQMYCYGLIAICTTLPTNYLRVFANIIITGFHFTVLQTQLPAVVLGVYIIIVLMSSMWLVNRFKQNVFIMGIYVTP